MATLFAHQEITTPQGMTGQTLAIATANPTNFHQAISTPGDMAGAEILAKLFLPGDGTWPLVIIVPGSLGIAPSHVAKADLLAGAGIATCIIDPFGNRGVTSTVANQTQYSFAASAWDVLASLRAMADHVAIDRARIGAQGHSRGGSAVLAAACMAQLAAVDAGPGLRGVFAAYPWCGQQFLRPDIGGTRVRAVIGDQDEWCLPQQVQAQIHAMQLCGGDATLRIFAGAQHSFDRDTGVEMIEDAAVSPGAPTAYLDASGAFIHPLESEPNPALNDRDLMVYGMKAGYGRKGARIGTQGDQADRFHEDMLEFWTSAVVR